MIRVAVGAICNGSGEILIALRSSSQHQGNLWEFPGGKIENGESTRKALVRELHEELGVTPTGFEPLIYIEHDYGDKHVALDVQRITSFEGEPFGAEGQPVRWVPISNLKDYDFPLANKPIINALALPDLVAISPEKISLDELAQFCKNAASMGAGMVYLRCNSFSSEDYLSACRLAGDICKDLGILLAANPIDGISGPAIIHLKAKDLYSFESSDFVNAHMVGASCHNAEEVKRAEQIGCDYVFLSAVKKTSSHPDAQVLGFNQFGEIAAKAKLPVYALGGMNFEDLSEAKARGAQGLAGIRIFK